MTIYHWTTARFCRSWSQWLHLVLTDPPMGTPLEGAPWEKAARAPKWTFQHDGLVPLLPMSRSYYRCDPAGCRDVGGVISRNWRASGSLDGVYRPTRIWMKPDGRTEVQGRSAMG